jgi:hypothetical protein
LKVNLVLKAKREINFTKNFGHRQINKNIPNKHGKEINIFLKGVTGFIFNINSKIKQKGKNCYTNN